MRLIPTASVMRRTTALTNSAALSDRKTTGKLAKVTEYLHQHFCNRLGLTARYYDKPDPPAEATHAGEDVLSVAGDRVEL